MQGTRHLGHREAQLVEFVDAHFHGANAAVRQREFQQDEGPQDAGAGGGRDADADAPPDGGEAGLGNFVCAGGGGGLGRGEGEARVVCSHHFGEC